MAIEEVDPDFLLADFGACVTAGAISGIGVLDENSQITLQGQAIIVNHALTCRTDLFGSLQHGAAITVNGEIFKVDHEPMRVADGTYCVIPLEKIQNYEAEQVDLRLDGEDADTSGTVTYEGGGEITDIILDGGDAASDKDIIIYEGGEA